MKTLLFSGAGAAFFAAAIWIMCGCETEKKPDPDLAIDPSSVTLTFGESVTLTAKGGWDYTWEILEPKHGTLSTYNGKQVTYTAPAADGTTTTTNALQVTDTIQVHSSSNHTAKAIITIKGE